MMIFLEAAARKKNCLIDRNGLLSEILQVMEDLSVVKVICLCGFEVLENDWRKIRPDKAF